MAFNTHVAESMWTPEFYNSKTHRRPVKIFLNKLGKLFLDGGHLKKGAAGSSITNTVTINKLYIQNKFSYLVFKHISV